jgi:hypothetical protein
MRGGLRSLNALVVERYRLATWTGCENRRVMQWEIVKIIEQRFRFEIDQVAVS